MKHMAFAFIAIFLAYGSEWIPFYISLFAGDELGTITKITEFETPCTVPPRKSSRCYHEYKISGDQLKSLSSSKKSREAGLGVLLVATEVFCSGSDAPDYVFDDPNSPGRSYEAYNTYITVPIKSRCVNGFVVRSWAKLDSSRHGLISGRFVVGSEVFVAAIKRGTEFLTKDARVLIALIFLFAYLIMSGSEKLVSSRGISEPFEDYLVAWIGFLLVSSGLLQLILPIHTSGFYTRLSAFFSTAAHLGPLVSAAGLSKLNSFRWKYFEMRPVKMAIWLFALTVALLPSLTLHFGTIILVPASFSVLYSLVTRNLALGSYAVILTLASLKLLNVGFAPFGHIAAFYAACVSIDLSLLRLRHSRHILGTINVGRSLVQTSMSAERFIETLSLVARQLKAERVTLIELGAKNDCTITFVDLENGSVKYGAFTRATIPAVATHIISTRQTAWHIRQGSDKYHQIKRQDPEPQKYRSESFSLIPLSDVDHLVAILSITNYDDRTSAINFEQGLRESSLQILNPYLVEVVRKRQQTKLLEGSERLVESRIMVEEIIRLIRDEGLVDLKIISSKIVNLVLRNLGTSGFLAQISRDNFKLEILGIEGYPTTLHQQLVRGAIYANPDNQQGPIPLAFSQNKIIIVSDINQIQHVLNPVSLKLLRDNNTGSIAAVPIQTLNSAERNQDGILPWGLLWIEQKVGQELTLSHEQTLIRLQNDIHSIFQTISDLKDITSANEAISHLMPRWAADRLILGQHPIEPETGYLLVLDLKSSSKIASEFGSARWVDFVQNNVLPRLKEICETFGFKLHQVIWDAFYMCHPSPHPSTEVFNSALGLCQELIAACQAEYDRAGFMEYLKVDRYFKPARACIGFGDTTRGLTPGPSPTWSIIGHSMAIVSKLEQSVKGASGDIFCLSQNLPNEGVELWEPTGRLVDAANDQAFSLTLNHVNSDYDLQKKDA